MSECIFCKIVKGEIPATILYEDDKVVAFKDIQPAAPNHLLVIPKKHIQSMAHVTEEDRQEILPQIFKVIQDLSVELGIKEEGFRIVNNCGKQGGQTVDHLHFHLLGGRQMLWPPG
ncbi:histidine triad nucleotide-binding protein [Clostridium formicaceticum]|uniref:HIT-like protein n=1 Tax=Clostridium formicaceticum TaxID=1497 RepID=A0AAC9WGS0_9CLOT|nr:histidine triad nucleotide-binding protein [Clostridium formicaceticum]AOY77563.1 histidine triad nucleotide-binding protein [Clostridium formicaceticum]ARE88141.1 HIT-like protein [Clostridium formicaceticum]